MTQQDESALQFSAKAAPGDNLPEVGYSSSHMSAHLSRGLDELQSSFVTDGNHKLATVQPIHDNREAGL